MTIQKLNTLDILDRITDGFRMLDADWNFIYINNEAERILGRSKEKLLGKYAWDEFPAIVYFPIYSDFHFAMEKQKTLHLEYYYPPMKKWFEVRAYPSIEGLTVYFLDITDRKRTSIRTDQCFESLFTNNPDAVYSYDLKGGKISVNKAIEELTGYLEEEIERMPIQSLIFKDDLEKLHYHFNEAIKGTPQHYECRLIRKSGRMIHIKVTNIPITIDFEVVGVFGIAKDITLQKIAEENIENSEKLSLVGQLSASIAHEIRNPLTTLKGFLQLIKGQNEISPHYIEIMLSEMDRIELITSELLLLAKPQAIEFHNENMREIIADVVTLLQSQALMRNIEIIFKHEEVGLIYCVSNQMKQVFINIIKNAIEAMADGGVIYVTLSNVDNYNVVIEVIDQGCGIPEELAANIGLPFYSTKEKGTGLGMLTTYKLVNDHGGKITFESKVGEGTTFKIYLPKKTLKMNENFQESRK
jgi:PAS domain S-box-containing protein